MVYVLIFIFGAIIGSFLNVCIYRMPRSESIISPGSRCVSCKRAIAWYDNIPFLSFFFLRGRCRSCKEKISFRYFAVEFISAAAFLILFSQFGFGQRFWVYSLLTFGLIIVTFIDLDFQIIPARISINGIFLGIILSVFMPGLHNAFTWKAGLFSSILGILIGGGILYFIRFLFNIVLWRIRRIGFCLRRNPYWRKRLARYRHMRESMGLGDVELMAMLGAFLGWEKAILIFLLAPFFGAPAGIYLLLRKRSNIIPYGPYISMASFVIMIYGQNILRCLFF